MTERDETTPRGKLAVEVRSGSMFLEQAVPIEVRDSHFRLVAKSTTQRTLDLPAGLYEVSAVLEDGQRYSEVVEIAGGTRTPVSFSLEGEAAPAAVAPAGAAAPAAAAPGAAAAPAAVAPGAAAPESVESVVPSYQRPRFTRSMEAALGSVAESGLDIAADTQLVELQGASLVRETRTLRIFQCAPTVNAVPSALFQVGSRRLRISLPISPQSWSPSGSCAVRIERTSTGVHAQAWITPERKVANALQNMLSSGYLLEAARIADDAMDLLRSKYLDPTGAALGALLLHKVGRLQRWESWVDNLARDFGWLPDGKVLLAQMRYERNDLSDPVLDLALQASGQRMLYAESYSLLLDLLRRWPKGGGREAIERLAGNAPYIDWESVCLSEWQPNGEE